MAYEICGISMYEPPPSLAFDGTPLTGNGGNFAASFNITGVGDGTAGRLYVLSLAVSGNSYDAHPLSVSGGTWTPLINTYAAAFFICTDTLNNQTVTVSRSNGGQGDYFDWTYTLYRFSSAHATQDGATTTSSNDGSSNLTSTLTATYAGSYVLSAGAAGAGTGSVAANNTSDYSAVTSALSMFGGHSHYTSKTTASGSYTVGYTGSMQYRRMAAVEIRSA